MREIKINLPASNQFDEVNDKEWSHRICAVCSLWMLLKLHNPEFDRSVMDLVKEGFAKNAYLEAVGWKHDGLVELAGEYGLKLQYTKIFFYTPEEKEAGLSIINRNLENGQPVLVSIHGSKNSHILVVHGLKESGGEVIGYHIQDPNGRVRGHNYFLRKQEFVSGWRGGLIYCD